MEDKKKVQEPSVPKPKLMELAKEVRSKGNKMSDEERETSFNRGMQLIYGGNRGVTAKTRSS